MLKNKIEKLISLIENTQIEEIEVSSFWGAQKIKLSKSKSEQKNSSNDKSQSLKREIVENVNTIDTIVKEKIEEIINLENVGNDKTPGTDDYEDKTKFKIITAPLVGTFYSSPKPEVPAFISIGDNVESGKVVCIIEAMKIFNEIESEDTGELVHIYVENGTPVEYGQELFVLRINNV